MVFDLSPVTCFPFVFDLCKMVIPMENSKGVAPPKPILTGEVVRKKKKAHRLLLGLMAAIFAGIVLAVVLVFIRKGASVVRFLPLEAAGSGDAVIELFEKDIGGAAIREKDLLSTMCLGVERRRKIRRIRKREMNLNTYEVVTGAGSENEASFEGQIVLHQDDILCVVGPLPLEKVMAVIGDLSEEAPGKAETGLEVAECITDGIRAGDFPDHCDEYLRNMIYIKKGCNVHERPDETSGKVVEGSLQNIVAEKRVLVSMDDWVGLVFLRQGEKKKGWIKEDCILYSGKTSMGEVTLSEGPEPDPEETADIYRQVYFEHIRKAEQFEIKGRTGEAVKEYRKAIDMNVPDTPVSELLQKIGRAYYKMGEYKEALGTFKEYFSSVDRDIQKFKEGSAGDIKLPIGNKVLEKVIKEKQELEQLYQEAEKRLEEVEKY